MFLARGWTRRVDRLVQATGAVASGQWDVQVGLEGRDELARLGQGFDRMVTTLDAQSRHLVEMETMAGWREMARALAHEVKNPLTPIQLTVEEMRERYAGDDHEYRALLEECTRIVIEEVSSLREVVGRFREFSRPVELERTAFDANALLSDIGAMQRDLRVELDLAENLPMAFGDADRLRQILMNLASNTREATRGQDAARLKLTTRVVESGIALVFEDDGPGIAPEDREHVFEPYRTGKKTGLGLGLALVKGIVLAHEGSIEVDEGRLGGARFTIVLPRAAEEKL
jgi:two-component system nitrogen regulation sensor histidine kinase NtrY